MNASLVRAAGGDRAVRAALDLLRNASGPAAVLVGAKFSVLRPRAAVAPHAGIDNLRVRHLVALRDGCADDGAKAPCVFLRAGHADPPRGFVAGEALSFDDSFWHEVTSTPRHVAPREVLMVEQVHPDVCGPGPTCDAHVESAYW